MIRPANRTPGLQRSKRRLEAPAAEEAEEYEDKHDDQDDPENAHARTS
jgi:hypothetical protein